MFWIQKKEQLICFFTIHFEKSIGDCGLVSISELPKQIQDTVSIQRRGESLADNYSNKTVASAPLPTTCLCVQLRKSYNGVVIDTAYPGIFGVDFPDKNTQTADEYSFNAAFWENHAFTK